MFKRIIKKQRKYILLFFITVLLPLLIPVNAFSAPVKMQYILGFNGHFKFKEWTPLTVILENRGQIVSGTLEIIVTSGSEIRKDVFPTTYSLDVELPNNSRKLCSFTILIQTIAHELQIRLRQGDRIILSTSINLRQYYTEKNLAVVVDSMITPDFLAMLPKELFTAHVPGRYLPEKWFNLLFSNYFNVIYKNSMQT